jgi:hypothetical protein
MPNHAADHPNGSTDSAGRQTSNGQTGRKAERNRTGLQQTGDQQCSDLAYGVREKRPDADNPSAKLKNTTSPLLRDPIQGLASARLPFSSGTSLRAMTRSYTPTAFRTSTPKISRAAPSMKRVGTSGNFSMETSISHMRTAEAFVAPNYPFTYLKQNKSLMEWLGALFLPKVGNA